MSKWHLIRNQPLLREIYKHISTSMHMGRVWPVNTSFHTWGRCLFILVDSRLKISLEKKSRQIQAESSDFILNPVYMTLLFFEVVRQGHQHRLL